MNVLKDAAEHIRVFGNPFAVEIETLSTELRHNVLSSVISNNWLKAFNGDRGKKKKLCALLPEECF